MSASEVLSTKCPMCDSTSLKSVPYEDKFNYRVGEKAVELIASYPVWSCHECNFVFSDEKAEIAKDAAIRKYLGILSPEQILSIRKNYSLSRHAFAELTGIGVASLSRWESGEVIQNKSNDMLLRFLMNKENFDAIRSGAIFGGGQHKEHPKLRALKDDALIKALKQEKLFHLNPIRSTAACI